MSPTNSPVSPTPSSSSGPTPGKQVIYVDVDDEITTIIDKMNATSARVIALVLPKRASVFQSVVNMKLLKHRADSAKKNMVLITSEAGLMPLAGSVGIHVAPTLQSKPEIPSGPLLLGSEEDDDEETATMDNVTDFDPSSNAGTTVGALASQGGAGINQGINNDDEDVVELDNSTKAGPFGLKDKLSGGAGSSQDKKAQKNQSPADKKLKVPNFFSFRKRLLLGALVLVLLIAGWYYAYFVMPKATVTIKTDASDITSNLDLTLDTSAGSVDTAKSVIPAQTKQEQKTNTQQVPATGQQNKGEKATGTVTMTSDICGTPGTPADVPAGTGIGSSAKLVYITQKTAAFSFAGISGGCIHFKSDTIAITAQAGGAQYNIASDTFTVRSDVTATGSAAGGTDNNVKVVQQSDIDAAKQKLTATQEQAALKKQLQQELESDKLFAIPASFSTGTPNVNTSSNVGDEADNVTVTQSTTYTMFGVHKDDLSKLVDASATKQIDTSKQSLLDDGVSKAKITVPNPGAGPQVKISLSAVSTAGPKLDVEAIKKQIVGMKSGNVQDKIKQNIGVKDVEVKYSPFWVTKAPKAERITIVFEKTGNSTGGDTGASSSGQ
jgi:hypothetical protein